jgi:tetratricopeptide (TPR) repeat protein
MLETSTRSRILGVWVTWKASSPGYLTDDGALERFRNVLIHRLAWKLTGRRMWNPALTDLDLAQRYKNQGRFLESEHLLLRIIGDLDVAPSDRVTAFMTLSSLHAGSLNLESAVDDIEDSLPLTNALDETRVIVELIPQIDRLAGRLTHEEDYTKALQLIKNALVYLPSSGRLWRRLGCVEWYSNDLVDALAAFDAALLNGENRGHVLHERGQVFAKMGQYSRAISELTEVLQEPRSSDSRSFATSARAYAFGMQGDLEHALKDFAEAESLTPENAWLFYFRGLCYLKYDMTSKALNRDGKTGD